jgi:hypothetical protein
LYGTVTKALLTSAGSAAIKRKPDRPKANPASVGVPTVQKRQKHRKLSAEARERIRQAQIKRWAAVKRAAKPDANAVAVLPSKAKKKAARDAT